MGRGGRNVRAKRVFQVVAKSYGGHIAGKEYPPPAWFKALESIPPTEVFTRPVALRHSGPPLKTSNMFQPTPIRYIEDNLRKEFYKDHPWELARPRIIMELDGKDARYLDWSKGLKQPGVPLSGECVVQRQLWLMENENMGRTQAYDKARKEFYALRQEEDVGRRVALEEARYVGAYFGKNHLQVGMEIEDGVYESWKAWAQEELVKAELKRNEAYTSFGEVDEASLEPEEAAVIS